MSDVLRQCGPIFTDIIAVLEAEFGPARQVPPEVVLPGEGAYRSAAVLHVHLARDSLHRRVTTAETLSHYLPRPIFHHFTPVLFRDLF